MLLAERVRGRSRNPSVVPARKRCQQALDLIGVLYGIERDVKDAAKVEGREPSADEMRTARQERSVPQLAAIRAWLERTEAQILPRGAMAEPIRYCLNQWQALCRYVEDGRLHIDNNLAERALRHFAVGRKNWLFFQTEGGGKTGAVLASLLQTARSIGLDPRTYFRDVLMRIGTETDVTKLAPHGWKQPFAKDVADHHEDILCRLRDHFAKAKWQPLGRGRRVTTCASRDGYGPPSPELAPRNNWTNPTAAARIPSRSRTTTWGGSHPLGVPIRKAGQHPHHEKHPSHTTRWAADGHRRPALHPDLPAGGPSPDERQNRSSQCWNRRYVRN